MVRRFMALWLVAGLALVVTAPAEAASRVEGIFGRLNKPIVPGMPALPGVPTASPLGLLLPRGSNLVSMVEKGGMRTQAGRLDALGVLSPRVSPVVAMVRGVPKTRSERLLYGTTILSPRAAAAIGMLQAARKIPGTMRTSATAMVPAVN
ncbi:MAG: hypothetical protein RLZZ440_728 [Planctomycetota bacterium]